MIKFIQSKRVYFLGLFFCLVFSVINAESLILSPPENPTASKFRVKAAVLIPGGKVPPSNYSSVAKSIQAGTDLRLWMGIPECPVNLCDPLDTMTPFGLQKIVDSLIQDINKSAGGVLQRSDIFIMGHSLGGVGARYYFEGNAGFAGLSIFGTQFIGDHLDMKGTLGLPKNLSAFNGPFLSVIGELDMIPFTHAARLLAQRDSLSPLEQAQKIVAVVPGMDHSDFCQGFHVSGDIQTEVSREEALNAIGSIVGAWLDLQLYTPKSYGWIKASNFIEDFTDKYTRPLMTPFLLALEIEKSEFCEKAQKIMSDFPKDDLPQLKIKAVNLDSLTNLMHAHGNVTYDNQTNTSSIYVPSYPSYDEISDFNYAPRYSGSSEVACKTLSSEKIYAAFNLSLSKSGKRATCKDVNRFSFDLAKELLSKYWPRALERFEAQGVKVKFEEDKPNYMGPQWVFLSHLGFDEKTGSISAASLYTPLNSPMFPGNFYCKSLSPSKAIEFIMVTSLTKRYP